MLSPARYNGAGISSSSSTSIVPLVYLLQTVCAMLLCSACQEAESLPLLLVLQIQEVVGHEALVVTRSIEW
jgi:hypothetical protein